MARAKTFIKRGRPNKPKVLRKDDIFKFRVGYRMNLGLTHYAKQRRVNRSRLVREALEYYFRFHIPKFKMCKDYVIPKDYIDYRRAPIIDYSFMFSDCVEIPRELTLEELDEYEYDDE